MGSERALWADRRFALRLIGWVALLVAGVLALAAALDHDGYRAVQVVCLLWVAGALAGLLRHVERTNILAARFVEALRNQDLAMRFEERGGAGFDALGRALNATMRDLAATRTREVEELRYWEALVDDLPIALLTVDGGGVRPANKAARRLFDRHEGTRPEDYAIYGESFAGRLADDGPSRQEVLLLRVGGGAQRALVRAEVIARLGLPVRVVAVEPVQAALDSAEVSTQSDLVRVLTHEILNSLTPVSSLAGTAAVLLGDEQPDIDEARLAVVTLARRADGLRRFIDSYRALARLPEPRRRRFAAEPFAAELVRLFEVEWLEHRLTVAVEPGLMLDADPDLLAQALINLLRNAAQATEARGRDAEVRLAIRGGVGGETTIEVEDNGPGIPASTRGDVFLPFFTTRASGSGVGLNLVRQIAVAHGWRVAADEGALGGALLRLVAPAAA